MIPVSGLYNGLYRTKARNPSARTIYDGLVGWWTADDNAANSNITDSHAGHTMTLRTGASTNNTSTQTATGGVLGSRYQNPARTDSRAAVMPRSDTSCDFTTDEDHCIGGWFRTGLNASTTSFIIGRVGSAFAKLHFWTFIDGADSIIKARYSADNTTAAATASTGVAVDGTTWHLIVACYDKSNSVLTIRLRKVGGSLNTGSVALGSAITSTSNDCNLTIGEGCENDSTFDAVNNRNGVLDWDEAFYSKIAMTDTLFNYLFNSGLGRTYKALQRDAF